MTPFDLQSFILGIGFGIVFAGIISALLDWKNKP